LQKSDPEISPSQIYAYAALKSGVPYANGAPHPEPASYAKRFAGKYAHRLIKGGIGHNLPQEAPREFAQAVVDVGAF